ncbi:MAG: NADH-quinone oxidoreductase subunit N [bacterium]
MQYTDLYRILPELIFTSAALIVLLLELVIKRKETIGFFAMISVAVTIYFMKWSLGSTSDGMFISDGYSMFFKLIFFINLVLCILMSIQYLKIEKSLRGEYFGLLMFSTAGMMIMASAGDLIVFYVGLELMALSTYILAGFLRSSRKSNEAGMKYFLLGAFSSAILLYGISLVYGLTGTTDISRLSVLLADPAKHTSPVLLFALVMFIAAFGFKIAAAPFHMWAPDVYEGAPTPITAFMSVGPKAAAFAAMGRVFLIALSSVNVSWTQILIPVAILTMAVGNIIAISQTNIKRMLAYSSIAHAGYAMLGIIVGNGEGVAAMMNYLMIYAFMNIGAFAVVIMLRSEGFSGENLTDYEGLAKTHPLPAALMLIFMFSLTGVPPTAGFIGKFYIFVSLIDAGYAWLALVAVTFSVISAYFYLRVVMLMYMKESTVRPSLSLTPGLGLTLGITTIMVLLIGILPTVLIEMARASSLL